MNYIERIIYTIGEFTIGQPIIAAIITATIVFVIYLALKSVHKIRFWKFLIVSFLVGFVCFIFLSYGWDNCLREAGGRHDQCAGYGFVLIFGFPIFVFYMWLSFGIVKVLAVIYDQVKKSQKSPESQNPHPQQ